VFKRQSVKSRKAAALVALAMVSVLTGCPISQEIKIKFPRNANWHFEYNDAVGEDLGFGKAEFDVDLDARAFTMTITENAFGDKAEIRGLFIDSADDAGRIPFDAKGKWFDGESYRMTGAFNDRLTGTLNCAIAYKESIHERIGGLRVDFEACRILTTDGTGTINDSKVDEDLLNGLFFFKASRQIPVQASLSGRPDTQSETWRNK
jgi:hypothetical protein